MRTFFLETGLVISRLGQILEFECRTSEELYFSEPETGRRVTLTEEAFWIELRHETLSILKAFSSPDVLLTPDSDEPEQLKSLEHLPERYQDDVHRRYWYIQQLKKQGITRGQLRLISEEVERLFAEIADPQGKPSAKTVSRWWKKYDQNNCEIFFLVSQNASRRRPKKLDAESEAFVQQHIDDVYATPTRPTVVGSYRDYVRKVRLANIARQEQSNHLPQLEALCRRSYLSRINERPKKNMAIARLGREAARKMFHMVKGHLPATYPLDVAEIDHTPLNLYVLDDEHFIPLGRPWLTAIKDRYSGILIGFYVSFYATGLKSIFGALKHSLYAHGKISALWPDIENPWPAFGRAHHYESDRGLDFLSRQYRNAIISLGGWYEYCERRTPWLKPSIERFFNTLEQTFFESMPGRTFASLQQRSDYDPVSNAVIRFSTLIYLLHKWAADFHNVFPNEYKQARPLDLWMDGIKIAPPPLIASPHALDIVLGQHYQGVLSHEGLRFQWLTFADDRLNELMDRIGKGARLTFTVELEDLGYIHVLDPTTNTYFKVPSTRPDYSAGLSLFQHQYIRRHGKELLTRKSAIDTLLNTRAAIQARIEEEIMTKNKASRVELARLANLNSNSVLADSLTSISTPFQERPGNPLPAEDTPFLQPEIAVPCTNVRKPRWGA